MKSERYAILGETRKSAFQQGPAISIVTGSNESWFDFGEPRRASSEFVETTIKLTRHLLSSSLESTI